MKQKKFYQKTWLIVLMLLIFTPVGIILLWTNHCFTPKTRKILSGVFSIYFVIMLIYSALTDDQDRDMQVVNNITPTPKATEGSAEIATPEPTSAAMEMPAQEPMETANAVEKSTEPIDVILDIEPIVKDNKISFIVKTNLPDDAVFMANLRGLDNDYNAGMSNLQSQNGKILSDGAFSNSGDGLASGAYELSVNLVGYQLQSQSVLNLTGSEYENLIGDCVSNDDGKFVEYKVTVKIENKERSLSNQKKINKSHKKLIKELYVDLVNECNVQMKVYKKLEFNRFLADWNRRRNDVSEKILSEEGTMDAQVIIGDLAIYETHLKNKVIGEDYDSDYIETMTEAIEDFLE